MAAPLIFSLALRCLVAAPFSASRLASLPFNASHFDYFFLNCLNVSSNSVCQTAQPAQSLNFSTNLGASPFSASRLVASPFSFITL